MEAETTESTSSRIAMLIDGDNAQASLIEQILAEASKYGVVGVRRVYGDWTTPEMNRWKNVLQEFAIQPIQQFRNTVGKNATDSAMIIDAMDILYSKTVDGFCLVSSDSDYTRLATRLRETGYFVMGIGGRKTPRSLVNACELFVFTENLTALEEKKDKRPPEEHVESTDPVPLLKKAYDLAMQEDGFAFLGALGNHLRQLDPSFDSRTYGHKQLSMLIRSYPKLFEIREDKSPSGPTLIYVRLKQ